MKDEFELFKLMCEVEHIVENYPAAGETLEKVKDIQQRLSERRYRVAMVGEFNRGKSSLINTLIGARVLPTDIIATTAVVNYIRYGENKSAKIYYKNGRTEEKSFEELLSYGTKLDREKADNAEKVDKIEVEYPAIFCQNGIEIIDTPGLNDTNQMTERTFGVLGRVDSAIMVIHAVYPLSESEKELVVRLVRQENIRHITFVVTFIDRFDEVEEQDRAIETIRERIKEDTYKMLESRAGDDEAVMEKGRKILLEPVIFGVSAKLAMESFVNENKKMLELSRFPQFKSELLALLTAGQGMDIRLETEECIEYVMNSIPVWKERSVNDIDSRLDKEKEYRESFDKYVNKSGQWVNNMLLSMEDGFYVKGFFEEAGLNSEVVSMIYKRCFIKELSGINKNTMTDDNIRECIKRAKKTVKESIAPESVKTVKKRITDEMAVAEKSFFEYLERMMPVVEKFTSAKDEFEAWRRQHESFPGFVWSMEPVPFVPTGVNLADIDVIPYIDKAIRKSVQTFSDNILDYINSWRAALLKANKKTIESCMKLISVNREKIDSLEYKKRMMDKDSSDVPALKKMLEEIR